MKYILNKLLRNRGKHKFISNLNPEASILDVGCGNNSPYLIKSMLPRSTYTGLDIGDYNQIKPNIANEYILTTSENFTNEIKKNICRYDAVISSHNIEHCDDRLGTFIAMLESLKVGGHLYISFPCEQSVSFPSRDGTLNYYDDKTHKQIPPDFDAFLNILKAKNFAIEFSVKNYRPYILWALGMLLEPYSKITNRTNSLTWAYYGFESIIWARKLN